jgi:hypothetical protein
MSDLFPNVGRCADDITFIKSIYGSNEAHGGALLKMNTGSDTFVRPSMGAWISYGLGTENDSLPSFVTINPTLGHGGVRNFGSAFLPPIHQATRIDSFELAFRMQTEAPEIFDLSKETEATRTLYGIDQEPTSNFGTQCLLARRLSESGVRFVQVSHAYWDQHSELKEEHTGLTAEVDKPIAGLLQDLKQRGLLEDTAADVGARSLAERRPRRAIMVATITHMRLRTGWRAQV